MIKTVGPGSHNRHTEKAIENLENAKNLIKECRCLIHLTDVRKGTVISKTKFNRQTNSKDGVQNWCAKGKTLRDDISHGLIRSIYLLLLTAIKNKTSIIETDEYKSFISISLFTQYDLIIQLNKIFDTQIIKDFNLASSNEEMSTELFYNTASFLKSSLGLKDLKFYSTYYNDENTAFKVYADFMCSLDTLTAVDKFNRLSCLVDNLSSNFYTQETADRSKYHLVTSVTKNWSKMNDLYEFKNGQYEKTNYCGPFHNTKEKAMGTTDRIVKYLVEIHKEEGFRETNAYYKSIKKSGCDIDHIWPLALGGKHTKTNGSSIPTTENSQKKDKITYEAYMKALSSVNTLNKMVSKEFIELFMDFHELVGEDEVLFNIHVNEFQIKLLNKMRKRQQSFENMSQDEKLVYLGKIRPDLNEKGCLYFIKRYNRKMQEKEIL